MSTKPIVIFDTMIVAAVFAVSKKGSHVENEKQIWRKAVKEIVTTVSPTLQARVPTPVCYELMAMNKEWYSHITESQLPFFRFCKTEIPNSILRVAAQYAVETNCTSTDGEKQKMKTMDPLIAAYAITDKMYILTTNQHDYPETHFSVSEVKVLSLIGKNGPYRTVLYLLKPKNMK